MMTHISTKPSSFRDSLRKKLDAEETKEELEDPVLGNPAKSDIHIKTLKTTKVFTNDYKKDYVKGTDEFGDKLSEKSEEKEGPQKKNADFEDLAHTGRWGAVSKMEVIIVTVMMVAIAVGVTIALLIFLGEGDDEKENTPNPPPLSKLLKPSEQMELIRSSLNGNPVTEGVWDDLGDDILKNPYRMAAAWIVEDDDLDREADIVPRFALATMYYSLGGNEWTNSTNWLTNTPLCDGWFGVNCDNHGNVLEIDLSENNLRGEIPLVLVLIEHLQVLWLNGNTLEGWVPENVFPRMNNLEILYLQMNNLTGPIPDNFLDNGEHLRKFNPTTSHNRRTTALHLLIHDSHSLDFQNRFSFTATVSTATFPRCTALVAATVRTHFSLLPSIAR